MSFLNDSVGAGRSNRRVDVDTLQQALNHYTKVPFAPLVVDGVWGSKTEAALERFAASQEIEWTGRVEPGDTLVKRLWPRAFSHPTGGRRRGRDPYGSGAFGASRGSRTHDGADYETVAGQIVRAPMSGRVTRQSHPYRSGVDAKRLSGLQIDASDGTTCWVWYITPTRDLVGQLVHAGDPVGTAESLQRRYPPIPAPMRNAGRMTDHVHIRLREAGGSSMNPEAVLR